MTGIRLTVFCTLLFSAFFATVYCQQGVGGRPCLADVVFVLDHSGSIRDANKAGEPDNWLTLLSFVKNVVSAFQVGKDLTRVGLVIFSNKAEVVFYLDKYDNTADMANAIDAIVYEGGFTNTTGALRLTRLEVFNRLKGDRPDVSDTIILITDGVPTLEEDGLNTQVDMVKQLHGIRMIAIGITNNIDEAQLRYFATDPDEEHYFHVKDFNALSRIVQKVILEACDPILVVPTPPPGQPGLPGPQGATGASGPYGPRGNPGTAGAPGQTGSTGRPGQNGQPGSTGPTGPSGPAGPQGATGQSGRSGPTGPTGPNGQPGIQGSTGQRGQPGNTGQQGFPGARGFQGYTGAPGVRGPLGFTGPQGLPGFNGATGPSGSTGPQGRPGNDGRQGSTGQSGFPGNNGAPGATGQTGPRGFAGVAGFPGPTGQTGQPGPQGSTGQSGSTGTDGRPGGRGPQGFPGQRGTSGATGHTGQDGYPGAGGATGQPGATGQSGPVGSPGGRGLTGSTGSSGGSGPRGFPGVPGPSGRTGGTGATGQPGQNGQAGSTGFPGPRGFPGAQGFNGATGSPGFPGSQGRTGSPGQGGKTGATGNNGQPGPSGSTGQQGPQGLSGATGRQGPQGFPGQNGNTGQSGPAGRTGSTGPQGYPGSSGRDGRTGATGQQGPAGRPGQNGAPGSPGRGLTLINECATGRGGCDSMCVDTYDSYYCTCYNGYALVNNRDWSCSSSNLLCRAMYGGTFCWCNDNIPPRRLNGTRCQNINECSNNNGGCQQVCVDVDGSFYCSCGLGFALAPNGWSCEDVDECTIPGSCGYLDVNSCVNTYGSYYCIPHENANLYSDRVNQPASLTGEIGMTAGATATNLALSATVAVVSTIAVVLMGFLAKRLYEKRRGKKNQGDENNLVNHTPKVIDTRSTWGFGSLASKFSANSQSSNSQMQLDGASAFDDDAISTVSGSTETSLESI